MVLIYNKQKLATSGSVVCVRYTIHNVYFGIRFLNAHYTAAIIDTQQRCYTLTICCTEYNSSVHIKVVCNLSKKRYRKESNVHMFLRTLRRMLFQLDKPGPKLCSQNAVSN